MLAGYLLYEVTLFLLVMNRCLVGRYSETLRLYKFPVFPQTFFLKINKFIYLFIWLRWVFVAVCGLSLVVVSGGCSLLRCTRWLLFVAKHRL